MKKRDDAIMSSMENTLPLPQDNPQYWTTLLAKLEERYDAQEQVLSNLMMGYIELAVMVEQCLNTILEPLDDNQKLAFAKAAQSQKEETFRLINTIANERAHDDSGTTLFDTGLADAMANMATPNFFNLPD